MRNRPNSKAKGKNLNVAELRQHIGLVWNELDQHIIDATIGQRRSCFTACVEARGRHFQHT